ncbi:hypothetical protein DKX38_006975 [Salix brachista]|uniref:TIR domain-containing protein n=1 Tax=Salix brachista TaxID=2182728 RepID=A0A5N5MPF4_9ROSI|nr:hypothetical protein DKX38_006975 [Salix brachista]
MDAREATGHFVLPIFYHLDPAEVRNQEGRYFEAFSAHERCFQGEMGRVEEWRAALRKAADVAGMVLQDRVLTLSDADLVEDHHLLLILRRPLATRYSSSVTVCSILTLP